MNFKKLPNLIRPSNNQLLATIEKYLNDQDVMTRQEQNKQDRNIQKQIKKYEQTVTVLQKSIGSKHNPEVKNKPRLVGKGNNQLNGQYGKQYKSSKRKNRRTAPEPMNYKSLLELAEKMQKEPKPKEPICQLLTSEQKRKLVEEVESAKKLRDPLKNIAIPKDNVRTNGLSRRFKINGNITAADNHSHGEKHALKVVRHDKTEHATGQRHKVPLLHKFQNAKNRDDKHKVVSHNGAERKYCTKDVGKDKNANGIVIGQVRKSALFDDHKQIKKSENDKTKSSDRTITVGKYAAQQVHKHKNRNDMERVGKSLSTDDRANSKSIHVRNESGRKYAEQDVQKDKNRQDKFKAADKIAKDDKSTTAKVRIINPYGNIKAADYKGPVPIFPPLDVPRRKKFKKKYNYYDDDEEDEYEEADSCEMDDFIVNDSNDTLNAKISAEICTLFRYDPSKYANMNEDDDICMVSSVADIRREEARSTRIAIMEDLAEFKKEQLRKKRKLNLKKQALLQKSSVRTK